jgi:Cu2+-containing amine oxidase
MRRLVVSSITTVGNYEYWLPVSLPGWHDRVRDEGDRRHQHDRLQFQAPKKYGTKSPRSIGIIIHQHASSACGSTWSEAAHENAQKTPTTFYG